MRRIIAPLAGLALSLFCTVSQAAYDDAVAWFEGMDWTTRAQVQADLMLTHRLDAPAESEMTRAIYDAVVGYQTDKGRPATGVLTPDDYDALDAETIAVEKRLGMERVEDEANHIALSLPLNLLTKRRIGENGTRYATVDGSLSVETRIERGDERQLRGLYRQAIAAAPGRVLSEKGYLAGRFFASGKQDGRFYFLYDEIQGTRIVGFTLQWSAAQSATALALRHYLAAGLEVLEPLADEQDAPRSASAEFRLPPDQPKIILLDSDIAGGTALNFLKALRQRPGAEMVALNSDGGNVETAMAMAAEIRRRGLNTYVPPNMGCYSACAYVYFAGRDHWTAGRLGVHQISFDGNDSRVLQATLSTVLDALSSYGVRQEVIGHMLRTEPDDMYVFSPREIEELDINSGAPVSASLALRDPLLDPLPEFGQKRFLAELAQYPSETVARRAFERLEKRFAPVLGPHRLEMRSAGSTWSIVVDVADEAAAEEVCRQVEAAGSLCQLREVN